jgi:hypothetical protein
MEIKEYPNIVHDSGFIQDSATGAGERLRWCPIKYFTITIS